jgi:hypothetical protein
MACTPRNRNKPCRAPSGRAPGRAAVLIFIFLASAGLPFIRTLPASAALSDYEPDIDIAAGTYNYFFNPGDGAPDVRTGIFFSGYMNMKSPLFTFFFNTKKIYTTYEAGLAYNMAGSEGYYIISIPLTFELSYRIPISRRLAIFPLAGAGFDLVDTRSDGRDSWNLYYLFDGGLEIKYNVWRDTYLKLKISYGVVFVETVPSGYVHVLKIRFPVPFVP